GSATDTGDADGDEIATAEVPALNREDWEKILETFRGDIEQVPPMYSALKKGGKRLYELARKGEVVEREPRRIRIHDISLLEASGKRLVLRVHCSKGTYVRVLVEDIARAAGTVAYTASLHRESVGDFRAEDMVDLSNADALREHLLPADAALAGWPEQQIDARAEERFLCGQAVALGGDAAETGRVRVYGGGEQFLGVGERLGNGLLVPRRIFRVADDPASRGQGEKP
ncbi:MAG: tRNA pseudouridine synthase B, partial [Woeseiaceae bacterium]